MGSQRVGHYLATEKQQWHRLTATDSKLVVVELGVGLGVGGKDALGIWDYQVQTITYKMEEQQGPTV